MTDIQVADATFVAAAPASAAGILADRSRWRRWWPDLRLTVTEDRAEQGLRWRVEGPVTGTMEIWCEPVLDGFVLHYFLHGRPAEELPTESRARADRLADLNHHRRVAGKVMAFAVKDVLEAGRDIGAPAVGADATGPAGVAV